MAAPGETSARGKVRYVLIAVGSVLGLFAMASPFLIRWFVAEAFQIPSAAMSPTLLVGDHMFAAKGIGAPRRGDVIVFRFPKDPSVDYVKRVVAVGGDVVQFDGQDIVLNGRLSPATESRRLAQPSQCPTSASASSGSRLWTITPSRSSPRPGDPA